MLNMTIVEAAEHFGISKEAIHNRIRRGSLNVNIVDGVKIVEIDDSKSAVQKRVYTKNTSPSTDDKYYKLLEEQNAKLQKRVEKLELETSSLRDQKEQMLIEEREKIEQIYKDKDEQLKNILTSISSQFMLNTPELESVEPTIEVLEAEIEVSKQNQTTKSDSKKANSKVISLKKYFKINKISVKQRDKILKKFKKIAKKDKRIITIGKKYYIDLKKYNYKDLLHK